VASADTAFIWRKIKRYSRRTSVGELEPRRIYVRPLGILWGRLAETAVAEGVAWPLVGRGAYTSCQVILRRNSYYQVAHMTVEALDLWRSRQSGALIEELGALLTNISNIPQSQVAGRDRGPSIVGILNLTPDSFSDGGDYTDVDNAIKRARTMVEHGASLIDIGGESTRPGATLISSRTEQSRVLPVAKALLAEGIAVSVDTYHPDTMEAACALGVNVINDVSGFTAYPNSMKVGAASGKTLVLAHSVPLKAEQEEEFDGGTAIEIYETLLERIKILEELGVSKSKIIIDPGLGFEKNQESNFNAMRWLSVLHGLGCQIMIGASRKFGRLAKGQSPKNRMAGSVAASLYATQQGVQLLRVHDVADTQQALGVWRAMG
jgi:dihydropteroate synthase